MRVGMGYDVHRLVEGRQLVLGGVEIPHPTGLLGHSDADVLLHAVMDALLGAAGLGDIGEHFPDTEPRCEGVSSRELLLQVGELLAGQGCAVQNIDATIVAQAPKLAPYVKEMEQTIAGTLGLSESQVNVKATTEEGLGFTGREEGIAAFAVCAIEEA